MAKKRAMNEQDKINLAKGKKFTKDYQPSPEKKREGQLRLSEKKQAKEIALDILYGQVKDPETGKDTNRMAVMLGTLIRKAMDGDTKSVELVLKLTEQLEGNKVIIDMLPTIIDDSKVIYEMKEDED